MDLKQYFRKLRQVEASLPERFPVVVSLETPDGGKQGLISEVSREMAAKMIVEGRAVLASEEEKELYRSKQANARQAAEKAELARRVQVAIINDSEIKHHIAAQLEDPCTTGE